MIFLVLLTLGILWYMGYQDKKSKEAKRAQYLAEIMEKEENLKKLVAQEMIAKNTKTTPALIKDGLIKISNGTSTEDYMNYGLKLAEAIKPLSEKRANETKTIIDIINNSDISKVKIITASRIIHEGVLENIKMIEVPQEISLRHTKLINQINLISSRLRNMEKVMESPTLALQEGEKLILDYKDFINSLETIDAFFANKKITFPEDKLTNIYLPY